MVALVTGANRGLGLETCRQLAREGMRVILTSRDAAGGAEAAATLVREGLSVEPRLLDVTDHRSIDALAKWLGDEGIAVEALVVNAGIALQGFDLEVVRRTLAVNFFGAMHVTDGLLPRMPEGSVIVMVSSGMGELSAFAPALRRRFLDPALDRAGLVALVDEFVQHVQRGDHAAHGWPSSAYRVSKAGLNALTRLLARELAPRRIHVNAVCPGWVRTDLGGPHADRDVEQGAASIVWAVHPGDATGGFFRDGRAIEW